MGKESRIIHKEAKENSQRKDKWRQWISGICNLP